MRMEVGLLIVKGKVDAHIDGNERNLQLIIDRLENEILIQIPSMANLKKQITTTKNSEPD